MPKVIVSRILLSAGTFRRLQRIAARTGAKTPVEVIRAAIDVYDELTLELSKRLEGWTKSMKRKGKRCRS